MKTKVITAPTTEPLVSFTFDDVPETAVTQGAALLEQHGARGTFYVAASLLGTSEPNRRLATLEQCIALHRRGHEIACHTYAHEHVATHDRSSLGADLSRSDAFFSEHAPEIKLTNFAYPYNATSLRAKRQLENRFTSCRGGVPGINVNRIDLGFLRAVELCDEMIDVTRVHAWIAEAVRRRGWLVFFTHGVTDQAEPWRCTPGLLEAAIRQAGERGCEMVTVENAMRRMATEAARKGQA